jgi:azurin/DNA-binding transcriptional ArsR family regulator
MGQHYLRRVRALTRYRSGRKRLLSLFLILAAAAARTGAVQEQQAPKILIDQPLRAVEYQLDRLSNDELVRVERKADDPRYRPVYMALLTRKGLARDARVEALATLAKLDKSDEARVLLDALAKVKPDDAQTPDQLIGMLAAQPAAVLRTNREALTKAVDAGGLPLVLRGAYAAMMIADGSPTAAWQAAVSREGHLVELLRSVPSLGKADQLRADLFAPISTLAAKATDPGTRAAAITALGWTRRDAATAQILAQEITKPGDPASQGAAIQALMLVPDAAWPKSDLQPLGQALLSLVKATEMEKRTQSPAVDAMQLGDRVAALLPSDAGRGLRRDLRALGVQVVRIEALLEQLRFDLNWFAVEAGKPVQIVLRNPDAMPHNVIVGKPGSLQEIGTAGGSMPMPTDPAVKPFVPASPLVLQATRLVQQGESDSLAFTAPKEPGEYIYLCSFPGHWLRMYGVMLVVESLDAWEAKPTTPTDPMTKQPFASQRN